MAPGPYLQVMDETNEPSHPERGKDYIFFTCLAFVITGYGFYSHRVETYTTENNELWKKVETLENANR